MTKYTIHLTSKASRDLKKMDRKIRERMVKKIKELSINQYPAQYKVMVGKKAAQYRLRVGDYRILYDVYDGDKAVLILRVGHRRDIYR